MKRLLAMTGVTITTGSTNDNAEHLPPEFLAKIRELYEGTRLGRHELQGAMILDSENALFKDSWLVHHEVREDLIDRLPLASTLLVVVMKSALWSVRSWDQIWCRAQ